MNAQGLALLKEHEGFVGVAKWDVTGYAIGHGNHYYEDGSPVRFGDTITRLRAEKLLTFYVNQYSANIKTVLKKTLNDNQFSAIINYAYNRGFAKFKSSKLLQLINAGADSATVANQFTTEWGSNQNYKTALIKRRAKEAALYQSRSGVIIQDNTPLIIIIIALTLYFIFKRVKAKNP